MKQIRLLLNLGVGALLGLSGCGSNSSNDTNQTTTTTATANANVTTSVVVAHHGINYQTVTSPNTGRIWLDKNLGAREACTSFNDEACYGDLYQWGRDTSGHEKRDSQTSNTRANSVTGTNSNFILIDVALDPTTESYDWVANGIDNSGEARRTNWNKTDGTSVCPFGFRLPTASELQDEVLNEGGVQNREDAFNLFLKIPSAGTRSYYNGNLETVGSRGYLWASDLGDGDYRAQRLQLTDITALWIDNVRRASSASIRCITDYTSPEDIPHSRPLGNLQNGDTLDNNETNTTILFNGVIYEPVSSPSTARVWLDRNLGATEVCTTMDDTACYGDYYQWGRDADGHEKTDSSATDTVATSIATAGDKFITNASDWLPSDATGALRTANWSKINGSSVCPANYRIPTALELTEEIAGVENREDAFNSFLKIPVAGYRSYTHENEFKLQGQEGGIWASTVSTSAVHADSAQYLNVTDITADVYNTSDRAYGRPIRCIKEL